MDLHSSFYDFCVGKRSLHFAIADGAELRTNLILDTTGTLGAMEPNDILPVRTGQPPLHGPGALVPSTDNACQNLMPKPMKLPILSSQVGLYVPSPRSSSMLYLNGPSQSKRRLGYFADPDSPSQMGMISFLQLPFGPVTAVDEEIYFYTKTYYQGPSMNKRSKCCPGVGAWENTWAVNLSATRDQRRFITKPALSSIQISKTRHGMSVSA
ncbi:uncharacterized protein BT62DRAFT_1081649 [Guyanagaster necrorhizus]|uniref:Uncharacterized protein n=1 Tax=Guyanagaster necrorhizus TaxID=856835 RepID=A0A9P7VEQ4_9AGAR|nr:uncharacterized protein BT62DRAFT_1081649 [Guyanagaster necrorhizus MCA 3950]KAG7439344.1 hypothetical protein BT62DRAFT_1081649 [Guyanagaster necrorhizus MCA 3950]